MNPESLDSSIQSALSALFPPFEVTAPTVLSQLFRTIEERFHGDALHCLLDFLIPSKHLLESVQQAACAAYSDVLFRCEGWPLCLRDRTVIQLAPLNPLLLRPGDFYLQVEPFGEQAARIVLKSLLEEGCHEVEETPIPDTTYPYIFTLDWLREVNDGRHGTPLSHCLLSTDQGVMKVPWAQVAIPEFLVKHKTMTTSSVIRDGPFESRKLQIPSSSDSTASALSLETMILPARDGISVSLRLMDGTSKLIKGDHEKSVTKPHAKPLVKPVGWVSPNTWDTSWNYCEIEGDYVDLVEFSKEKESPAGCSRTPKPSNPPPLFKPVRPPPPIPLGSSTPCGCTLRFSEEPCTPCSQRRLGQEPSGHELKCRYRDSYLAALRNPVPFERGSLGLLAALEESGPCGGEESGFKGHARGLGQDHWECCNHYKEPSVSHEPHQHGHFAKESPNLNHIPHKLNKPSLTHKPGKHTKEPQVIHKLCQVEPHYQELQTNHKAHQTGPDSMLMLPPGGHHQGVVDAFDCDFTSKPVWNPEAVKTIGKHKAKPRALSTVSETARGSPLVHKLNNRSHSGPDTKLQSPKTKPSAPPILPPSPIHRAPPYPPSQESIFRSISGLLHLGFVSLPGSRDRVGRAVLEVHGTRQAWMSPLLSAQEVCKVLLYLHSIPRKEVRDLGMTVVINARKMHPPSLFYKALMMVQEQALNAVHSVLILVDKDTSPRPERHPGLQMEVLTSLKALHKMVEGQQLTSDLGGNFPYSHTDWLQFHQKLVSFVSDLQGAAHLLHRAIKKIDGNPKTDTAQDVQLSIQDQKTSMKEVLQDARLVPLQREGGAILTRMRREEFRFTKSDDYRDALDSVTVLYNQVEENVHTLVMKSNESLQYLDFLLKLREAESNLNTAKAWFDTEGEQWLKFSNSTEDTLESVNQALQRFDTVLTQAKEKKQETLTLVMEVEKILGSTNSNPETEVFRTAAALAKECKQYLEQLETGCYPAKACLSMLKTYEERLGDCFSSRHFQKIKACSVKSSRGMNLWNATWVQCQEVSQWLGERLQQGNAANKYQQQLTAGGAQVKDRVLETWKERRKRRKTRRRHHSETDLRTGDLVAGCEAFPWKHGTLGGSLSEGSCISSPLSSKYGSSPLSARHSHSQPSVVALQSPQNPYDISHNGSFWKLQRIMEELLLTEREYVRSLGYVREHYFPELERPDVPQDLRGQRGSIFGNLEKLHDFHRHHFLKELEGCLREPFRVGRSFLRHRECFGLYALYSKNKPKSDSLLLNHGHDFFKQKQIELGDKMDLSSYLLKPVQRISKYSLLLQDMVRDCGPHRGREEAEVRRALEVIQFQLRHGNNLLAMDDIQDCDVNLKEQGQLIRQDEFLVSFRKKKCFRHIFLFQDLVLFSKTKWTDVGNDTYVYKQSFKTSDIGMTHNSGDSGLCFEIWFRRRKSQDTYTLQAGNSEVKDAWTKDLERILWEQAVHNREIRMQERVFMGIGNRPFMDIQPSDAAINDRAVNCALMGRESKVLASSGTSSSQGGCPVLRPNSIGSGSCSSSSGSHSSSSSGRGSLSSAVEGYLCGPKRRGAGGHGGYSPPPGVQEEDDMDQESGSQNLLMNSSESSGESVSGFSSSSHSCHSAIGREAEDSVVGLKEVLTRRPEANLHKAKSPTRSTERTTTPLLPHRPPAMTKDPPKVQTVAIGKSTEV
ncbi:puratrophin-1-like [Oncorhynchus nerka]|uniref:puratrophin-1-like n=1 Tax=Oncorhynchus nerka TaxID=8023 RepID=UPI0031B80CFA